MKKTPLILLFCVLMQEATLRAQGIPISKTMFGINAWFLNFAESDLNDFGEEFIVYLNDIKASGVTHVRIGGIDPNWETIYNFDATTRAVVPQHVDRLEKLIRAIRDAGMEVIMQVSYNPVCPSFSPLSGNNGLGALTLAQQAEVAGNLVALLNNTVFPNNPIIHWSIANEPDQPVPTCTNTILDGGFGASLASTVTGVSSATFIAEYIKAFSTQMKSADPQILIMGPELASFGSDGGIDGSGNYFNPIHKVMKDLLSPASNTACSIMGKVNVPGGQEWMVDIVSFHHYAIQQFNSSASDIINEPASALNGLRKSFTNSGSAANGGTMMGLTEMILAGGRSYTNMSIACTEINIDATNSSTSIDESTNRAGVISSFDNRSFLAGQWLCESFSEAMKMAGGTPGNYIPWVSMMNLWSVKEGGCKVTSGGKPLGYISGCATYTNTKRPMYHHYSMMANNFKGHYYAGTVSGGTHVKAFAAKSGDRIAVMVLNQDNSDYTFEVGLASMPSSTQAVNINVGIPGLIGLTNYFGDHSNTTIRKHLAANSTMLLI